MKYLLIKPMRKKKILIITEKQAKKLINQLINESKMNFLVKAIVPVSN